MLTQLIISSIVIGSIYALMAMAMSITYKASEIPNFAQGDMAMLSSYTAFVLFTVQGWPFYLAFLGALVFAFFLGVILDFAFVRRAKEPTPLSFIIITIGFQMFLYGLAGWKFGSDQRRLDLPFSQSEVLFRVGDTVVTELNLATVVIALLLMLAVYLFLEHTRIGLAMRAAQQHNMAAMINGIPTNRIMAITFGISSVVGTIAGLLVAPITTLDPAMMWDTLLKGFAAAVLGGMKSLPGVVAGAFMLSILENLFGYYVSLEFKSVVAFMLIVLVLFFRPSGLFGKHYLRKV